MTPEERACLESIVKSLDWRIGSNVLGNYCLDRTGYQITYFDESPNEYYFGKKSYKTLDDAKAACRTHQLEQVRKIFGDEGMAELLEMFDLYQYVATDMG